MDSFEEKLLRLKKSLNIYKDKEISELLGLNQKSFSARKSRNAFPEEKLLTLVMEQPDLGIDIEYVLTGRPSDNMTRAEAKRLGIYKPDPFITNAIASIDDDESRDDEPFSIEPPVPDGLTKDEWELIQRLRASSLEIKVQVMQLLLKVDMTENATGTNVNVSGSGNRVAGRNYNERKK